MARCRAQAKPGVSDVKKNPSFKRAPSCVCFPMFSFRHRVVIREKIKLFVVWLSRHVCRCPTTSLTVSHHPRGKEGMANTKERSRQKTPGTLCSPLRAMGGVDRAAAGAATHRVSERGGRVTKETSAAARPHSVARRSLAALPPLSLCAPSETTTHDVDQGGRHRERDRGGWRWRRPRVNENGRGERNEKVTAQTVSIRSALASSPESLASWARGV